MRRHLPLVLAILLSLGLALFALQPAWWEPSRWMIGNWYHPDCQSNHWLLVWVSEQLAQGQGLVHNDRYYWPVGDAPVVSGNGAEGVLYLPFHLLLGWPVGVVYYALLALTLNGLGGYALARAAGADRWASLVAASTTGLLPYALRELSSGRFTQVSVCWLLFFLAAWLRFLDAPGRGRALLAGLALAATAFFYWYYGLFAVVAGGVLLGVRAIWQRALPPVRSLALFSATFLLLIAPWAWMFASNWGLVPGTDELTQFPHPEALHQAWRPRWPFLIQEGTEIAHAMAATTFFLAIGGALLAVLPRRPTEPPAWRGPAALGLVLVWGLFYVLSLGPLFPGAPYTLLYGIAEPLRRFWWPIRHEGVAQAAAAALAALALSAITSRLRSRIAAAALGIGLAVAGPVLIRLQGVRHEVELSALKVPPPVYPALAGRPGAGLVEPPLAPQLGGAQQHLLYQLYHDKTLLNGTALWVERVRPRAWDAFVAENTFLTALQRMERGELGTTFSFEAADLQHLLDNGFRYYSVNREMFTLAFRDLVDVYAALFTGLFGQPVLRHTGIKVWDASSWNGETEITIPAFSWPRGVVPGGPSQRVGGKRPPSLSFGKGRGGRPLPGEF